MNHFSVPTLDVGAVSKCNLSRVMISTMTSLEERLRFMTAEWGHLCITFSYIANACFIHCINIKPFVLLRMACAPGIEVTQRL